MMPINPLIPLSAEFGSFSGARNLASEAKKADLSNQLIQSQVDKASLLAPIEAELNKQNAEQLKAKAAAEKQDALFKKVGLAGSLASVFAGLDPERASALYDSMNPALIQELQFTKEQALDKDFLTGMTSLAEQFKTANREKSGGEWIVGQTAKVTLPDGSPGFAVTKTNKYTNQTVVETTPFEGQFVNELGQTNQQKVQDTVAAAAGSAKESVIGKAEGEAYSLGPGVISKAEKAIGVIDALLSHPGRSEASGFSGVISPSNYRPGSKAYDFALLLEQAKGGAFLEGAQALKGFGQLSNTEGPKAEAATAQLSRRLSDEELVNSLKTLRSTYENSIKKTSRLIQNRGRFDPGEFVDSAGGQQQGNAPKRIAIDINGNIVK